MSAKQQLHFSNDADDSGQAVMLWGLGDWASLLDVSNTWSAKQQQALAPYKISALLQTGEIEQAQTILKAFNKKAEQSERDLLAKLLVAGVLNSLGRASACNFEHAKAEMFFKQSLEIGFVYPTTESVQQARLSNQLAQLGVVHIRQNLINSSFTPDVGYFLQTAKVFFQHEPAFELALADYYQRSQSFDQAIVHWQQVSAMLEKDTPQPYYERLQDAYRQVKGFPAGSVEQEELKGDTDKHKLLAAIHGRLQPEFYFEIGVQTGKSLAIAKCEALGVDPMPLLNVALASNAKVLTASSDAFFGQKSDILFTKTVDLAFIDGMHLFEYALRDFINTERHAKPYSIIVIDDIYPGHVDQAKRNRCTRAWTGDVWKVKAALQQYRPDLVILAIDAYPTGLLLITGLDPYSNVLSDNYNEIVQQFMPVDTVPENIMKRTNAVSGSSEKIYQLIDLIRESKKQNLDAKIIQGKWFEMIATDTGNQ
jgi:tetratricopeptide (TPR) repeat protein